MRCDEDTTGSTKMFLTAKEWVAISKPYVPADT